MTAVDPNDCPDCRLQAGRTGELCAGHVAVMRGWLVEARRALRALEAERAGELGAWWELVDVHEAVG